jgi:hypothetical protein
MRRRGGLRPTLHTEDFVEELTEIEAEGRFSSAAMAWPE